MKTCEFEEVFRVPCGLRRYRTAEAVQNLKRELEQTVERMVRRVARRGRASSSIERYLVTAIAEYKREAPYPEREQLVHEVSRHVCEGLLAELQLEFLAPNGVIGCRRKE